MAQTITCDVVLAHGAANWLVTHLDDGEALAYCDSCYLALMLSTVEAVERA